MGSQIARVRERVNSEVGKGRGKLVNDREGFVACHVGTQFCFRVYVCCYLNQEQQDKKEEGTSVKDADGMKWAVGLTKETVMVIPKMSIKDYSKLLYTSMTLNPPSPPESVGPGQNDCIPFLMGYKLSEPDGNGLKVE
ncbi:hypothetical protein E6C27_scaffold1876G00110 [Cucumis melo var. makuwa]|uniref:Uncharacterized protein n=1 Tax=Cucumis melo var. makuwa TaxID=1194695 RepID=A0A5A7SMN2_CUCMM|nr:hypothetical protein E6C27_scaffold1876G00110 [Cucumis melo var. makuwa]